MMNTEHEHTESGSSPPGAATNHPSSLRRSSAPRPRSNAVANQSRSVGGGCPSPTKAGGPCRATPTSDGYCPRHSPRFNAEQRSAWSRRGALVHKKAKAQAELAQETEAVTALVPVELVPSLSTTGDVRSFLERTATKVERGALMPAQAGALGNLAALALKVIELEVEQRLLEEELRAQTLGDSPSITVVSP